MIIAIGTKNPAKIEGVQKGFARFFSDLEFRSVDTAPVMVKAQPVGLDQITEGATIRARFALAEAGGDFGVGVEAGIFRLGGRYFDHQQAAVVDKTGRMSLGHSAGFPLPTAPVEKLMREGGELEHYAVQLTGIGDVGDKGGLIHHLTKGQISRTDLTEQCVITALIPWLHRDVYSLGSV
jgi:inosine/xanthosine triphosphatase